MYESINSYIKYIGLRENELVKSVNKTAYKASKLKRRKIMKKFICLFITLAVVFSAIIPASAAYETDVADAQVLTTSEMAYLMSEAGIEVSANSDIRQINYITSDGNVGGAIVSTTANDDFAVTDLVIPYVCDTSENRIVNALSEGYTNSPGTSTLEYIFISARYYYYYYDHPTTFIRYYRPSSISASYTSRNASFEIFSMTVECVSTGKVYDTNFQLYANSYNHLMNFYQAHPVSGTYYSSPSSQALSSSYWMGFTGASALTGEGAFYTVAYSGYLNGQFVSINDQIAVPILTV